MFTISLCMIVKNEEQTLSRVLDCAKEFADEIVIVDTGSSDKTKEIARKFTSNVYDFRWQDDFALARNFAFSKATCDYQMWLDADDFITKENIEKIQRLKNDQNDSVDVFMLKYSIGFDKQNHPYMTYFRERLLRRKSHFFWQGQVHEAIAPAGKIEYCDITIEHRKVSASDPKRNLKIYQKMIKNGIMLNPRELYYYSRELYYNGQYKKAISNLKKFIKIKGTFHPDNLGAYLILSECQEILGLHGKSIKTLFEALDCHTPNAEICCNLGSLYDKQNKKKHAIFWYESAIACEKQTDGFVREDCQEFIPCLQLCKLFYEIGYVDKSKKWHERAKALRPDHPAVIFNEKFFKQ